MELNAQWVRFLFNTNNKAIIKNETKMASRVSTFDPYTSSDSFGE